MLNLSRENQQSHENIRFYSSAQVNEFLTHAKNLYKFFSNKYLHGAIDVLRICSKIKEKNCSASENWNLLIAKAYEQLMLQREKKGDPAASHFCQLAIKHYKLAKDISKARGLEVKYTELRNKIGIFKVKTEIDLSSYYEHIIEISDEITDLSSDEIIECLMHSDIILPELGDAEITAQDVIQNSIRYKLFPIQVINRLGNTVQVPSTDEEILNFVTHEQYSHMLNMFKWPQINMIFVKAYKKGKFTGDAFIDYLRRKTWLGKEITRNSPNGPVTYCWLEMISPAIRLYFRDMPGIRKDDTVLSLDSLVLKIEGIVRDLCRLKQIPITVFENVKNGLIAHERDINALLFDPEISRIIEPSDLFFFRFILIEQTGANLRNDIAHALLPYDHYSLEFLNLLLLIILRLAKIKVEIIQSENSIDESV